MGFRALSMEAGEDSNPRPSGCEPAELRASFTSPVTVGLDAPACGHPFATPPAVEGTSTLITRRRASSQGRKRVWRLRTRHAVRVAEKVERHARYPQRACLGDVRVDRRKEIVACQRREDVVVAVT